MLIIMRMWATTHAVWSATGTNSDHDIVIAGAFAYPDA